MNNTKTLTIVAIFIAATLVVGIGTFTTTTTQSAYAYQKKGGGDNGKGNGNGNTVTIEECKNRGSSSGFDTALDQECENLICTHPGENATCVQEGVRSISTSTPTPEPITTTLRVIKKVVCLPTDPNCSLPSTCTLSVVATSTTQTFNCQSAVGNGLLFTLQPGDRFNVSEEQAGAPFFDATLEGDCGQGTIAEGQHLKCTFTNTEPGT